MASQPPTRIARQQQAFNTCPSHRRIEGTEAYNMHRQIEGAEASNMHPRRSDAQQNGNTIKLR